MKTLAERLGAESDIALRAAVSSEIVVKLLQPEMDKFEALTPPWDIYTVRKWVDHNNSARKDRQLSQDLAIAAAIVRAAGDRA